MLEVKDLSLEFINGKKIFSNINFEIKKNSITLLTGKSGCGKSSLLMCLAGVIPEIIEAYMSGEILFNNRNIEDKNIKHISGEIAYMFQDPDSQLCTFTVEDEIAFGLENKNIPQDKIDSIINETLELVGIMNLKKRNLNKLSGGEKQKVALASILALDPQLILMDEPTANLDPISTIEIVSLIKKLRDEMGKTIIVIEHKINEFEEIIDNVIMFEDNKVIDITKNEFINNYKSLYKLEAKDSINNNITKEKILEVKDLTFYYEKNNIILNNLNFSLNKGEITAIVGPNGAGKSTLSKILIGFNKPTKGEVILANKNLHSLTARQIGESLGLVFQNPEHQFIKMTVEKELALSLEVRNIEEKEIVNRTKYYLDRFDLYNDKEKNPFLLSQGQKRRLSTASMMINGQEILILDEPTYGQDRNNLNELVKLLNEINRDKRSILMITHDLDLVSSCCDKIILLENGEIKYNGSDIETVKELFFRKRGINNA